MSGSPDSSRKNRHVLQPRVCHALNSDSLANKQESPQLLSPQLGHSRAQPQLSKAPIYSSQLILQACSARPRPGPDSAQGNSRCSRTQPGAPDRQSPCLVTPEPPQTHHCGFSYTTDEAPPGESWRVSHTQEAWGSEPAPSPCHHCPGPHPQQVLPEATRTAMIRVGARELWCPCLVNRSGARLSS